jgi:hypothetical protein
MWLDISSWSLCIQFEVCMANENTTLPDGGVTVPAEVAVLVLFGLSDRSGDFPLDISCCCLWSCSIYKQINIKNKTTKNFLTTARTTHSISNHTHSSKERNQFSNAMKK